MPYDTNEGYVIMWHVMVMHTDSLSYHEAYQGRYDNREEAIMHAHRNNVMEDYQGRYFVVSEQEYQEYWKRVVS